MNRREDILSGRFVLMLERKVAEGIEGPHPIVALGCHTSHGHEWKTSLHVMKRK